MTIIKTHHLLRCLLPFSLLLGLALSYTSHSAAETPVVLDIKSGTVLGVTLGMNEKEVRKALETAGIRDVKRVDYPTHFLLQSGSLIQKVSGGLVFRFRDGKTLTTIYSNARLIRLGEVEGLSVGMPLSEYATAFGKVNKIELLPNRTHRATHFRIELVCLTVITDAVSSDEVLAFELQTCAAQASYKK